MPNWWKPASKWPHTKLNSTILRVNTRNIISLLLFCVCVSVKGRPQLLRLIRLCSFESRRWGCVLWYGWLNRAQASYITFPWWSLQIAGWKAQTLLHPGMFFFCSSKSLHRFCFPNKALSCSLCRLAEALNWTEALKLTVEKMAPPRSLWKQTSSMLSLQPQVDTQTQVIVLYKYCFFFIYHSDTPFVLSPICL